jgi:hypothetical protein
MIFESMSSLTMLKLHSFVKKKATNSKGIRYLHNSNLIVTIMLSQYVSKGHFAQNACQIKIERGHVL